MKRRRCGTGEDGKMELKELARKTGSVKKIQNLLKR